MASRHELQGAFASLADTLRDGFDPSAEQDVRELWLGVTVYQASVARRREWLSLARDCDAYAPVIAQLGVAATALQTVCDLQQTLTALELGNVAIALVEGVLDTDPCGGGTD